MADLSKRAESAAFVAGPRLNGLHLRSLVPLLPILVIFISTKQSRPT